MSNETSALERLQIKADTADQDRPAISIVRRRVKGLEVSYIWQAALLNMDGRQLRMELARPFKNFKEGREQLAELLGKEPKKVAFLAVRGGRTYYPKPEELETLTVEKVTPIPDLEQPEETELDFTHLRSTF